MLFIKIRHKYFRLALPCLAVTSIVAYIVYGSYAFPTAYLTFFKYAPIENAERSVYRPLTRLSTDQISEMLTTRLKLPTNATQFSVTSLCKPYLSYNIACVQENCSQLSRNPEERVRSLISNKTILSQDQEQLLNSIAAQIPVNDVLLLTAASSNHFLEMAALLRNLHTQVFPELGRQYNFSLVVWDLGLNVTERLQMEQCCKCQVISFPFHQFPVVARYLHCYMWKPLIVWMSLTRARKFVIWNDSSVRYHQYPGPIFERGMKYGIQLKRLKITTSIPMRTLNETFYYLGQEPCSFQPYPEVWATWGFYKSDPFVLNALASPWARCALETSCMCPKPPSHWLSCDNRQCHRFDQSALGIITATLYGPDLWRILMFTDKESKKIISFKRGHQDPVYFKSLGCLKP